MSYMIGDIQADKLQRHIRQIAPVDEVIIQLDDSGLRLGLFVLRDYNCAAVLFNR